MKKVIFFLLLITITTLSYFTSLNAQWYDKSNGLPIGLAYAIDAYDSLIATGSYTVNSSWIPDSLYLTTDGGNNWFSRPLPGVGPIDISIKGENKIWFCTDDGKIYKTIDGGFNWQLQFYDTLMTKFMNYIEMFDSLNGMAMGDAPTNNKHALFLKTTNGGATWEQQSNDSINPLHSVYFTGADKGWSVGWYGIILSTVNGGSSWSVQNSGTIRNLNSVFFPTIFPFDYSINCDNIIFI